MLRLLLACQIFFFCLFCTDGKLQLSETKKYLEFNSGQSFELTCIGPPTKQWNYPRMQFLDSSTGSTEIPNVIIHQRADNSEVSILTVQNASYLDTGAYQCSNSNGTSFENVEIYVFVRDEAHLLLVASDHLYALQFSNFTLPCKPTARDVSVNLRKKIRGKWKKFKVGEEGIDDTTMVGAPLEYHDEKGFILPFVTDEVKGRYKCIGERKGNKLEEVEIFVGFLRAFDTLNKPHIVANKTFVVVGDYVELDCTLLEESDIDVWTKWTVPEKVNKDYEPTNDSKIISENGTGVTIRHFHNRLVLRNVGLDHTGDYTCAYIEKYKNNINSVKYHMNVHHKVTTFLNLTCKDAPVKTAPPSTTEQRITVRINANPRVDKVNWYFINWKEEKIEIFYVRKYKNESFHENYETLIISSPELNDSGIYRLVASNRVISSSIDIKFYVEAKPHILKPLNLLNDNGLREYSGGSYLLTDYASHHVISCLSIGYPKPTVSWYFQELSDFSSVIGDKRHKIPSFYYRTVENNNSFDIITDSILKGESLRSGILYCNSCNILGCQETSTEFFVTDVKNGFETWGRPYDLIGGDNGTIYCGASKFLFGPALKWSYKFQSQQHDLTLLNDSNIFITNTETELSYISTMVMRNVSTNMTGSYTCEAESLSEKSKNQRLSIFIKVKPCSLPVFLNETSLDNGTRSVEYEDSFELECSAEGLPQPSIIWYYNDKEITELLETGTIDHGRISLTEGNKTLKFVHATEAENGNYSCKAINRLGSVWAHSIIIVASPKVNRLWPWVIVFTIFIIFFLSVIIIILYQRVKHERALLRELTKTVLETFDDGAEGDLNPELGIVEQADLLPYKKQYEFPRENLRLGKQLGSGAFGVVLKGEANGILKDNEVTAVAVKMLKQNVDVSHIKALTTELKVMIHLGKHLNVVNLLGACTRNLNNRELLVIVEYCRYGNMHDYLRRNRNNFINQINPKTGLFDSNLIGTRITESERRRLFPTQSTSSYTGATHSDSSVTFYSNCTVMTDFYSNQQAPSSRLVHNYKNLAIDPLDEEDDYIVSKDLLPALKPQSKGEHEFCTEDLLCWSFQTACGMEYLASRKVLHGDLAARNILLAENNIIKICDFGMSKNMHYEDNYCKKGKQLLPVKWLSIEAMRDREFSVYSDIWSFGVVLWEFFSLARTPYPGLEGVQELYKKLESGYRMERPVFAPDIVYRIMLECWSEDPKRRPPFSDLTARLGYMIDRDVQKYFLDLSEQMAKSNEEDEDESACLIQPLNMEYQNLIKKDIESSKDKKQTKDKKTVKEVELLELKPAPQNGVDPKSDQCGFSNQTYGNVDLERNVRTEEILLV